MDASKLQCLFQTWGHSREEDANGVTVYRPAGYKFPLSRGRDALEFRPDGTIVKSGPGADDRSRSAAGEWKSSGDKTLDVRLAADSPPRHMTIVDCDEQILKVRWD
jgi:hypothetical protein